MVTTLTHDDDNDGIIDSDDAFALEANENLDTDSDGIGDNADPDDDGDGVSDVTMRSRLIPVSSQTRIRMVLGITAIWMMMVTVLMTLKTRFLWMPQSFRIRTQTE